MASEKILLVALAVVFLFGFIQADLIEQDTPEQDAYIKCGPWSKCSTTCGPGKKTRKCSYSPYDPPKIQTRHCNLGCCPVNGGWTHWSSWSKCKNYCVQVRKRTCTNPKPSCGGKNCRGKSTQQRKCNRPYPYPKCTPVYVGDAQDPGYYGGYYGQYPVYRATRRPYYYGKRAARKYGYGGKGKYGGYGRYRGHHGGKYGGYGGYGKRAAKKYGYGYGGRGKYGGYGGYYGGKYGGYGGYGKRSKSKSKSKSKYYYH